MLRCWGLQETDRSYEQWFGFSNSQWQKSLPKVKKSRKMGEGDIPRYNQQQNILSKVRKSIKIPQVQWELVRKLRHTVYILNFNFQFICCK